MIVYLKEVDLKNTVKAYVRGFSKRKRKNNFLSVRMAYLLWKSLIQRTEFQDYTPLFFENLHKGLLLSYFFLHKRYLEIFIGNPGNP